MASENETVASVTDCIRHMADNMPNGVILNIAQCNFTADRIESAWRREKAEREIIDRNAHTITADSTTYDEHWGVNAIVKEWRERPITVHTEPEESARLDKLENAYYAEMRKRTPTRNCDRFASYKDAWKAFQKLHENDVPVVAEMLQWLFAPVAEGGES